jgi:hypothetical protein
MVNVFSKLVSSNYFTPAVVGTAVAVLIARHYWTSHDETLTIQKVDSATIENQTKNIDVHTSENLLHKNRNFEPEYDGYLSNHLSMGIISIKGISYDQKVLILAMNGDEKQVEEFYNVYVKR